MSASPALVAIDASLLEPTQLDQFALANLQNALIELMPPKREVIRPRNPPSRAELEDWAKNVRLEMAQGSFEGSYGRFTLKAVCSFQQQENLPLGQQGKSCGKMDRPTADRLNQYLMDLGLISRPGAPVYGPGQTAPDVTIDLATATGQYRDAFSDAVGGDANTRDGLVWVDGDSELLVRPMGVRLNLLDGFALVGIPVNCEQTGDAEVVVPFALGRQDVRLGMIMATEDAPRGPSLIVKRWGDQLTAAAWLAFVRMAGRLAAAAGVDDQHYALIPAALTAVPQALSVTPQARHRFDRDEP